MSQRFNGSRRNSSHSPSPPPPLLGAPQKFPLFDKNMINSYKLDVKSHSKESLEIDDSKPISGLNLSLLKPEIRASFDLPRYPIEEVEQETRAAKSMIKDQMSFKRKSHHVPHSVHLTQTFPLINGADRLAINDLKIDGDITDSSEAKRTPGLNDLSTLPGDSAFLHDCESIQYQRVSVSGDEIGVPIYDYIHSSKAIFESLRLREKYAYLSFQSFPTFSSRYLKSLYKFSHFQSDIVKQENKMSLEDHPINPPTMTKKGNPYECSLLPDLHLKVISKDGIFNILRHSTGNHGKQNGIPNFDSAKNGNCTKEDQGENGLKCFENEEFMFPRLGKDEYLKDSLILQDILTDVTIKSFTYRRLCYLSCRFQLHLYLNELRETSGQKCIKHRDFYNIRKVDTHIHAASCMNQKHLLRFIKKTLKRSACERKVEIVTKDGKTLSQVFDEMKISPQDLSVDMLDVHADRDTFHRFDKFNAKYNPIGESKIREIFIKTNNFVGGKYFAKIMKEVMSDLEESKYTNSEPRLSIYGSDMNEWDKLAHWAVNFAVYSENVRFLIQVPRLYDIYRTKNLVSNFEQILNNIFLPLFEATNDPSSHPELYMFLNQIVGFDSVDDESKTENEYFNSLSPLPVDWNTPENPPYSYYLYYMWANMMTLNHFRKSRGLNTFVLRPHCGEAGPAQHLITSFMLAENISHGLLLRKAPVLQYLYYLAQIGIAMSPLSNNSLFLN
ncbi:unnamed protein product [Gordionus sp. m RMFG-2023]